MQADMAAPDKLNATLLLSLESRGLTPIYILHIRPILRA